MPPASIEQARAAYSALAEFFASHPKGRLDAEATRDVRVLCRAAETAVSDDACRRAIRSIESYADLLSSAEPARHGFRAASCRQCAGLVSQQAEGDRRRMICYERNP